MLLVDRLIFTVKSNAAVFDCSGFLCDNQYNVSYI